MTGRREERATRAKDAKQPRDKVAGGTGLAKLAGEKAGSASWFGGVEIEDDVVTADCAGDAAAPLLLEIVIVLENDQWPSGAQAEVPRRRFTEEGYLFGRRTLAWNSSPPPHQSL